MPRIKYYCLLVTSEIMGRVFLLREDNNYTITHWVWTDKSKGLQEDPGADQSFTFGR